MSDTTSDEQARIYEERALEYDTLISAEDVDGHLEEALSQWAPIDGARIADVGAGTGRLARLFAARCRHMHLIDRAAPMLEVARDRLAAIGLADKITVHHADARELPLDDESVDIAMAGWVFGHFRHWMPDGWRAEVDAALAEMRRVVVAGGPIVVIETLGTGHEVPRQRSILEEYFAHLEGEHGFERSWIRTDYEFADVSTAASVMGGFFGEELVARIRSEAWCRVPECTALFTL